MLPSYNTVLANLPHELITKIFSFASIKGLIIFSLSNKEYNRLAQDYLVSLEYFKQLIPIISGESPIPYDIAYKVYHRSDTKENRGPIIFQIVKKAPLTGEENAFTLLMHSQTKPAKNRPLIKDLRASYNGQTLAECIKDRLGNVENRIEIPNNFIAVLQNPVDDNGNTLAHLIFSTPSWRHMNLRHDAPYDFLYLENADGKRVVDVVNTRSTPALAPFTLAHSALTKYHILLIISSIALAIMAPIVAQVLFEKIPNHVVFTVLGQQINVPLALVSLSCLQFFAVGTYFMHELNSRDLYLTMQRTAPATLIALNFYLVKHVLENSIWSVLYSGIIYGAVGVLSFNSYSKFKSEEKMSTAIFLSCAGIGIGVHYGILNSLTSTAQTMMNAHPFAEGAFVLCISGASLVTIQYVYEWLYSFADAIYYDILKR